MDKNSVLDLLMDTRVNGIWTASWKRMKNTRESPGSHLNI